MYNDSGIYCYKNKLNGKLYIGQTKNFKARNQKFYNPLCDYGGAAINNARQKYGVECFEYSILTHCPINELDYWETFYINRLKTVTPNGYNMTAGGDSIYIDINKKEEKLKKYISSCNSSIDTSLIVYKNSRSKVHLRCPIHGDFYKTPNSIYNRDSSPLLCPHCIKEETNKNVEKKILAKIKKKWGDTYTYKNLQITSWQDIITVTCPKHGDFTVMAGNHVKKDPIQGGCPICSKERQHNTKMKKGEENAISKIKEKFGDAYSFEHFNYQGDKEKVTVTCPKHGDFTMRVNNLVHSYGCPICKKENYYMLYKNLEQRQKKDINKIQSEIECIENEASNLQKLLSEKQNTITNLNIDIEELQNRIKLKTSQLKSQKKESNELRNEINKREKKLSVLKGSLIRKQNHYDSIYANKIENSLKQEKLNVVKDSTEVFKKEAIKVHGNKYDYSQTKYVNSHTLVKIICPEHGMFEQYPMNHIRGCGCAKCGIIKYRSDKRYLVQMNMDGEPIATWKTITEVEINGKKGHYGKISACCLGKQKSAYGFKWKYVTNNTRAILQFTKDNVLVKKWDSFDEIYNKKPIRSPQHIKKCLEGISKTAGGYIWKWEPIDNLTDI